MAAYDNDEMTNIDLLIRRGFLIEKIEDEIFLSDNAHPDDLRYLSFLLREYGVGYIENNGSIIINDNSNKLKNIFMPVKKGTVGTESNNRSYPLVFLKTRECANKIPLCYLEANIAYYIKALSACGIYTGGCCDGNHPGCNVLYIEFDAPLYEEFHEALWDYYLSNRFLLQWKKHYTTIDLSADRQGQYNTLYKAGNYIYQNRLFFREVRMEAAKWIKKNTVKEMSYDEIKEKFLGEVRKQLEYGI